MVPDVVNPCGNASAGRSFVRNRNDSLDDIVDEGKVALHISMIEYCDRLAGEDRLHKEKRRHVRSPPRAVNRKEPKAGGGDLVQVAVAVRHKLPRLLRGCVERDGMINP